MPVSADTLCKSGMSYPKAIEIARQMNAGVGNVNQLVAIGMVGQAATELVRQINAVSFDADKLAKFGIHMGAALVIKKTSGA